MLLDLNGNVLSNPIAQPSARDIWKEYIEYKEKCHLLLYTKEELYKRINAIKKQGRSIIKSAIIIRDFIRELSVNENFNQQFESTFPKIDRDSVLGMQLYLLLLEDDDKWIFLEPESDDSMYIEAHYVISKE